MLDKKETVTLTIDGMHCTHCQTAVTAALKAVKGVKAAQVSLEDHTATVTFAVGKTTIDVLCAAVKDAGFEAHP